MNINRQYKKIAGITALSIIIALSLCTTGCPPYKGTYDNSDTNGLARGVTVQNIYAYVADGIRGLKIFNISNPDSVVQVGALDLPGFNSQVAVRSSTAVLTDTEQNKIYIIDVSNKSNPQLTWTYNTIDKPIALAIMNDIVYVAEKGDNSQSNAYFSGIEAVTCGLSSPPNQLSTPPTNAICDVIVSYYLYAVSSNQLYILDKSPAGVINATPLSVFNFAPNESIQSLDFAYDHLLVLGQNLYVMNTSTPSAPTIVDSQAVPGFSDNRVISSSGLVVWGYLPMGYVGLPYWKIQYICFCYSTQREFGWGRIDPGTKEILFLQQEVDIYADSEGHARLYDIQLIHRGGLIRELPYVRGAKTVAAVGALDNYGLALEILEEISWDEFSGP